MTAELIGIHYSPWTEKARWAMDLRQVSYRYREHLLIFGMPELRWRTGHWWGALTVPVLIEDARVFGDSWDIARHADALAQARDGGATIFPIAQLARIEKYNALSEKAADAGRILVSARVLRDAEAKVEVLPAFIPRPFRRLLSWLAWVGVSYIRREFGFGAGDEQRAVETLREAWTELARDLKASGGQYLIGNQLTYADIAMAVTLQALEPAARGPALGPAYRRCWATPELRQEFGHLLVWRDSLYERYRNARKEES